MKRRRARNILSALCGGAALSTLFFLPLVQALESNIALLLWRPADTAGFAASFASVGLIFGVAWYLLERLVEASTLRLAGLALLSAVPLASAAAAIGRQFSSTIDPIRSFPRAGLVALAVALVVFMAGVTRFPQRTLLVLRGGLLAASPASVIVLALLLGLTGAPGPDSRHRVAVPTPSTMQGFQRLSSIYVFLFDELSYRLICRDGAVRPDMPRLRRFSEGATNYMAAFAPDDRTLTSLPGLLAARDLVDVTVAGDELLETVPAGGRVPLDLTGREGLFHRAKARGLRTEMIGYYLPYCRLLDNVADSCVSHSWYNHFEAGARFPLLDPVLATIVLWPYQPPFGVVKVPALSALQRQIVEQTTAAAVADLRSDTPRFRFVHFSVPHLPFVFDRQGYNPPSDPMAKTSENYVRQLQYVDTLVATLLDHLGEAGELERSTVVVMADHEYRWPPLAKAESLHIPLIVKRPGQRTRKDVTDPVKASRVLEELVSADAQR